VAQLGRGRRLRVVELVGGRGFAPQADALRAGAEVVVGTPGRVLDHLKPGTLRLTGLSYLVLDDADEMLDQGFGPDVDRILAHVPPRAAAPAAGVGAANGAAPAARQHALFSATLPEWARAVAARLLVDPVEARVDDGRPAAVAPESVDHVVYEVPAGAKPSVLRALLATEQATGEATLVFGRTRHGVRKLAKQLTQEGYLAGALQSDLSQNARDRVIASFRAGEIPILVATNVAARGLDIAGLGRVINYDLPENGALFTHRVGRTGRMGRAGQAVTLLDPDDAAKWRQLEKELKAAGLTRTFPRQLWTGPLPEVPTRSAQPPQPRQSLQPAQAAAARATQPARAPQHAFRRPPATGRPPLGARG
jgi:ATP-dependent RNA helicase DeaD